MRIQINCPAWAVLPLIAAASISLTGCSSLLREGTADLAGIAGAGAASAVTDSAAAGAAIGLGVRTLAREGLRYAERRVRRGTQDAVATAAGPLEPGVVAPWAIQHDIPIEADEQGQLVVSRVFGTEAFRCKEVVFSVDTEDRGVPRRAFYTTTICRDADAWRWAAAEPTTERWSGLQ